MPQVQLEKPPHLSHKQAPWKSALPFVENARGSLVHRIRHGSTYSIHKNPHIGITFWCGMSVTASDGKLSFLDAPSGDKPLCERCEDAATKRGQPPADELAGHHVHTGKTVAVVTCCKQSIGE